VVDRFFLMETFFERFTVRTLFPDRTVLWLRSVFSIVVSLVTGSAGDRGREAAAGTEVRAPRRACSAGDGAMPAAATVSIAGVRLPVSSSPPRVHTAKKIKRRTPATAPAWI